MSWSSCCGLRPSPEDSSDEDIPLNVFTLDPIQRLHNGVTSVYPNIAKSYSYPVFTSDSIKNIIKAKRYKMEAVTQHGKRKHTLAMGNIILSIGVCPNVIYRDYAFGVRSCILYFIGDYISALVDVNRILKNNRGPKNFMLQMNEQKARCITSANRMLRYMENFKQEQQRKITDPDRYNSIMFFIKLFLEKMRYGPNNTYIDYDRKLHIPTIHYKNSLLSNASAKIKISKNEIKKRYIEAVDDIDTGEILMVDKPLIFTLYQQHTLTHCSHCFVRCTSLIPCEKCCIMFCSRKCYKKAVRQYHRVECRVFQFSEKHKFYIADSKLMALKLFLISTQDGVLLRTLMNDQVYGNPWSKKDFNFESVYVPEDYFNIHNLEDNYEYLSTDEWDVYTEEASFLLLCLKKISFFNAFQVEQNQEHLTVLEEYAGKLLLKFLLCVSENMHEVTEFIDLPNNTDNELPIGIALYPTLRFASHSCNQNTVRYFCKNYVVVRAFRPILTGEEVFDNYGVSYMSLPTQIRRAHLIENYYFLCQCDACEENWPILKDLPSDFSLAQCLIPREEINMNQFEEWSQMFDKISPGYSDQALSFFYMYLTFLSKTIRTPFKEHALVEMCIQLILLYRGNYYNYTTDALLNIQKYFSEREKRY